MRALRGHACSKHDGKWRAGLERTGEEEKDVGGFAELLCWPRTCMKVSSVSKEALSRNDGIPGASD